MAICPGFRACRFGVFAGHADADEHNADDDVPPRPAPHRWRRDAFTGEWAGGCSLDTRICTSMTLVVESRHGIRKGCLATQHQPKIREKRSTVA